MKAPLGNVIDYIVRIQAHTHTHTDGYID